VKQQWERDLDVFFGTMLLGLALLGIAGLVIWWFL